MADKYHHGNSPAAWTAVLIIFIGTVVGSAYTIMAQPLGVVAGGVIIALGGIAGLVLKGMGFGQQQVPASAAHVAKAKVRAGSAQPAGVTAGAAGTDPEPEQATVGG
ncbi:HGxxPAAW family protein [Streptomyces millisiae]|uniref:HGxxPAAW family protein n=1 Tax=Streptomyces millisiae TaxID=3075542 RepID=A0ABU2LT99_9ACTN|nr:HGxxPAAW family protein [Streptomyces sp. DSM 44918]MDT0320820.1 HGxxPAAW family protein [Streptomyces sp. DSM 44918]